MTRFIKKQSASRAFTLIEVLVSLLIFTIVVTMAIGAIFSLVNAGEKARSLNSVMENLNIALETMARTVRTGSSYNQGDQDGQLESSLTFTPALNNTLNLGGRADFLKYELLNNQIVQISTTNNVQSAPIPITAAEVHINNLSFWTYNSVATAPAESYVVMSVDGYAETRAENKVNFTIQTTMTGRSAASANTQ